MSVASPLKQASASINHGVWKRKGSEDDDEDNQGTDFKKARYSWYVTLESESPQPTDSESDNESIYSVQGQETEFARDTSDTSTNSWISLSDHSNMSAQVEYEVASSSESNNPLFDSLSSSDPQDYVSAGVIAVICDSDVDLADDSDDGQKSVDSEIGRADYWTCIQCRNSNNNPLFRYCEKCYQLRKNFFPPRPKWKRRRNRSVSKQTGQKPITPTPTPEELTSVDSGLGSSQGSQSISEYDAEVSPLTTTEAPSSTVVSTIDSVDTIDGELNIMQNKAQLEKSVSTLSTMSNLSTLSATTMDALKNRTESDVESKFCMVCTVSPKNGAFVHGNASHICCCYRCAIKVWKTKKCCPICNRKVTNVLKTFYS